MLEQANQATQDNVRQRLGDANAAYAQSKRALEALQLAWKLRQGAQKLLGESEATAAGPDRSERHRWTRAFQTDNGELTLSSSHATTDPMTVAALDAVVRAAHTRMHADHLVESEAPVEADGEDGEDET